MDSVPEAVHEFERLEHNPLGIRAKGVAMHPETLAKLQANDPYKTLWAEQFIGRDIVVTTNVPKDKLRLVPDVEVDYIRDRNGVIYQHFEGASVRRKPTTETRFRRGAQVSPQGELVQ